MDRDFLTGPGILIVSNANWDGWPVGVPTAYVGPFDSYEEAAKWRQRNGGSGKHFSWEQLTSPKEESNA